MSTTLRGTISGFASLLVWSTSATLVAFMGRLPPLEVVTITWIFASLSLAGFYLVRGEKLLPHFRRPVGDYMFVTVGIGVYTALYYMGFKYAPVFEANTLNYLWPILLMFFFSLFHKLPFSKLTLAGMGLGFAGTIILCLVREGGATFGDLTIGHGCALAAAVIWALYSCFASKKDYDSAFLIPVFIVCSALTFMISILLESWIMPNFSEWVIIVLLGATRLAYVFWDYAMRKGNQLLVTSGTYFTPLLSTIILILFGFGTSNPLIAASAAMIIAGCILANGDKLKKLYHKLKTGQVKA